MQWLLTNSSVQTEEYILKLCLPLSGGIVPIIPQHYIELSGQLQAPVSLTPGKECPITHRIVELVGPRAGLNNLGKRKLLALLTVEQQILMPIPCSLSCVTFVMFISCMYVRWYQIAIQVTINMWELTYTISVFVPIFT